MGLVWILGCVNLVLIGFNIHGYVKLRGERQMSDFQAQHYMESRETYMRLCGEMEELKKRKPNMTSRGKKRGRAVFDGAGEDLVDALLNRKETKH